MRLEEECGIKIDQSTIYRILKRRNIRYYEDYSKEKRKYKQKAKLYVLDNP
jgi:transposase